MSGEQNIFFPIPANPEEQTPAQRWVSRERERRLRVGGYDNRLEYTSAGWTPEWVIDGSVHVFEADGKVMYTCRAGLRFGQYYYMQGYEPLCLAVKFGDNDKHRVVPSETRCDAGSGTITGAIGYFCTFVFCPHPFQTEKLRRLFAACPKLIHLEHFIGAHIMRNELLVKL
jgi:hypothetical protein